MKEKSSLVLIITQMSRVLQILEDYCLFRQYSKYCYEIYSMNITQYLLIVSRSMKVLHRWMPPELVKISLEKAAFGTDVYFLGICFQIQIVSLINKFGLGNLHSEGSV